MSGKLAGKKAVIVGATSGMGRATALAFAREGARVVASDIDIGKLRGLAEAGVAETHLVDMRNTKSVEEAAKRIGPVDILFNCAGFVHHGTVLECTDADWDFAFDLNVRSMHRSVRAFLPGMLAKGRGSIVNIASAASSIRGIPNRFIYATTKAAVIGLTKSVAADYIRQGVRCNAICPGTVQSPSLDDRIAVQAQALGKAADEVRQAFIDRQPMGRLGTAEEVAAIAVYLAADESAFTTGQTFLVDGGFAL